MYLCELIQLNKEKAVVDQSQSKDLEEGIRIFIGFRARHGLGSSLSFEILVDDPGRRLL